jgi:hypothetical protein
MKFAQGGFVSGSNSRVGPPLKYSKLLIKSFPESIIYTDNQDFSGFRKVSEQKLLGSLLPRIIPRLTQIKKARV